MPYFFALKVYINDRRISHVIGCCYAAAAAGGKLFYQAVLGGRFEVSLTLKKLTILGSQNNCQVSQSKGRNFLASLFSKRQIN